MHGAPIFSALATEASGVDLIYVVIPDWHENTAKGYSPNFQVCPFATDDDLCYADVESILGLLATMDCAVLGPGVNHANEESIASLIQIIEGASCSLVLDAAALQPDTLKAIKGKNAVLTPHLGELERMKLTEKDMEKSAKTSGATILLKGEKDIIVGPNNKEEIKGGNAGLTVGGTGDVLAGLICGLMAQKMEAFEAAVLGAKIMKAAADKLEKDKGYAFTAMDVVGEIGGLVKKLN